MWPCLKSKAGKLHPGLTKWALKTDLFSLPRLGNLLLGKTHHGMKIGFLRASLIRKKMNVQPLTSSNSFSPSGSTLDSSLNASSPTKQISWPSWKGAAQLQPMARRNLNPVQYFFLVLLTGSARITTCTVALPGVSKLTRGVRIFWFSFFIRASMFGSWKQIFFSINTKNCLPPAVGWGKRWGKWGWYLFLGTGEGDTSKCCPVIHCPSNSLQLQLALEQGKTQPGLQGHWSPGSSFFSRMWGIPKIPHPRISQQARITRANHSFAFLKKDTAGCIQLQLKHS